MIRLLVLTVLVLTGGSITVWLLQNDTGYLLVSYGNSTLEVRFWTGIIGLCLVGFIAYWLFAVMRKAVVSLGVSLRWWSENRSKRTERKTQRGLIRFLQGDWISAKKELMGAAKLSDNPHVHYLAAAKSALYLKQWDEAEFLIGQLEKNGQGARLGRKKGDNNETSNGTKANVSVGQASVGLISVALVKAEYAMQKRDYTLCIEQVKNIKNIQPDNVVAHDYLCKSYMELRRWDDLVALLPSLEKHHVYESTELHALARHVYVSLLTAQTQLDDLKSVWNDLSKKYKQDAGIVKAYASGLIEFSDHNEAESIIRKALSKSWSQALVGLYGNVESSDIAAQLRSAEIWLQEHTKDDVLMLTLGRLAEKNKLWGKARDYYQQSILLGASADAYLAMADFLVSRGDHVSSIGFYKNAIEVESK